jgi:signal transduction histidine kinase
LTAGVAHEINNPLSSITTNVQNIAYEIEDPQQKRAVEYIQQETRRIRDIVGRLLEFAGTNGNGHRSADLNAEARLVIETVRYSFPADSGVVVTTRLEDGLPEAGIPADELRQILLNVITNAFQATDGYGRMIRVSTSREDEMLRLSVEDDGVGISEDTRQRMFDPFFTTKPSGSGLGLSVVYGLLSNHGGTCSIDSAEGRGTTVELGLPIRSEETS